MQAKQWSYLLTILKNSNQQRKETTNSKIKTNGQVLYILNYIKYDKSKDFENFAKIEVNITAQKNAMETNVKKKSEKRIPNVYNWECS